MQSKIHSLIEALTNKLVGFIIALIGAFIIYPIVDVDVSLTKNIVITAWFSLLAIPRSYIIRRIFNKFTDFQHSNLLIDTEDKNLPDFLKRQSN